MVSGLSYWIIQIYNLVLLATFVIGASIGIGCFVLNGPESLLIASIIMVFGTAGLIIIGSIGSPKDSCWAAAESEMLRKSKNKRRSD